MITDSPTLTARAPWRTAAGACAAGPVAGAVVAVLANGASALPFAAVVTVLFAAAALWTARGSGRTAPAVLGVLAVLYLAFQGSFGLLDNLVRPSSWPTFVGDGLTLLGVLGIVVAVLLRGRLPRSRTFLAAAGGLALVCVATSVVAILLAGDPAAGAGDVRVAMASTDTAFSCSVPATLPAGTQTVFVRNDDTTPHQLLIGGATIEVRAGGTARQQLTLPAGAVPWRCVYFGHDDITGTARAR